MYLPTYNTFNTQNVKVYLFFVTTWVPVLNLKFPPHYFHILMLSFIIFRMIKMMKF